MELTSQDSLAFRSEFLRCSTHHFGKLYIIDQINLSQLLNYLIEYLLWINVVTFI